MKQAKLIKRDKANAQATPAQAPSVQVATWNARNAVRAKQSATNNAAQNARKAFRNLFNK